ncbi:MAG TPA: hypothetical protein VG651_02615 [Stellaceae bacterium]|nr:hypothetical protein [Stellaceae bacterium]
MTAHRALPTPALGQTSDLTALPGTSSGCRNLFGDVPAEERYRGFGFDEAERLKNRQMFRWLAARFAEPYAWPDGNPDNRRISAGYIYFAQFVIHDVVLSLADLPDLETGTIWPRNYRSSRLMLDAIYGTGPLADPVLYSSCPALPPAKSFLRIGGRDCAGPLRDLPRSPCPFTSKPAYSDVLIADARNDDHVIIAQLTVVFHLLHNIVYSALVGKNPSEPDLRVFALAQRVVTRVYRQILIGDLLKKLLHPAVYDAFWSGATTRLARGATRGCRSSFPTRQPASATSWRVTVTRLTTIPTSSQTIRALRACCARLRPFGRRPCPWRRSG